MMSQKIANECNAFVCCYDFGWDFHGRSNFLSKFDKISTVTVLTKTEDCVEEHSHWDNRL